jgi:hypothetical protein
MHSFAQFQPRVSLDEHVRRAHITLGESLSTRRAIYLDVKYWIILRAAAEDLDNTSAVELLTLLRAGVAAGILFCPIEASVFIEMMKQNLSSRLKTAVLINELSLGGSLVSQETRIGTEIAHFLHTNSYQGDLHPLKHLVDCA